MPDTTIGEILKRIRRGDVRRRIRYDEESGDFVIADEETPLNNGEQDATPFAGEGFA